VTAVVVSGKTEPLGLAVPVVGHMPEEEMLALMETTELPPRLPLQRPVVTSRVCPPLAQFEVAGELNHWAPVSVQVVPVGVEHWHVPTPQVRPSIAFV
jgi:hypothetical protein